MKVILNRKEEVDMDPKELHDQYLNEQITHPFIYHGKKYVMRECKTKTNLQTGDPQIEVFLEEI